MLVNHNQLILILAVLFPKIISTYKYKNTSLYSREVVGYIDEIVGMDFSKGTCNTPTFTFILNNGSSMRIRVTLPNIVIDKYIRFLKLGLILSVDGAYYKKTSTSCSSPVYCDIIVMKYAVLRFGGLHAGFTTVDDCFPEVLFKNLGRHTGLARK